MTRVVKTFHKRRNCPKCLGTAKTDSYDMVISGIRNVTWGNKNPKTCFNSIKHGFVGVKNDPQFNTARRIQFCAAYQNLNKINNKKDWFAPSIKGLQCKKTPNQKFYKRPRIAGGTEAAANSWPWIARIDLQDAPNRGSWSCAGTIIDPKTIVTSAYCVDESRSWYVQTGVVKTVIAHVGEHNHPVDNTDDHSWKNIPGMKKSFTATKFIMHPKYESDKHTSAYDVAVLKFKENIITNSAADFACLHSENDQLEEGMTCYTAGWGFNANWSQSGTLFETDARIVSDETCRYNTTYDPSDLRDYEFCAGKMEGGSSRCVGDEGAPLICNINGQPTLVGITGWGKPGRFNPFMTTESNRKKRCQKPKTPPIYTKVSNDEIKQFILEHVEP